MTGDIEEKNKIEDNKKDLNLEELKKQLEECQKLKEEYLAGWQRARADFLNYKKEEMERIGEILKYAAEEFILRILPVLDNFEIVEKKLPENLKNDENIKGLLQIKTQIQDFLKNQGLEEIKTLGEKFDPNLHEAVEEIEPSFVKASAGKEIKSGIIVEEIQKGYKINGRLLRPAKVKVIK
ncbi:MAG: nucleotide exchange factor GrpE [Candidatus Nealsonbacteria bacterium CG02_land_8_20_14_3_00_37_10]|uniref:Protein GrpE n=2 Tax=Candidatus Nealsoniibacteriota TaxID=1817911 RepID=A0A2M7D9B3_9BACT|nr:MAG: nucleotide exchange factor GrpE [Candidatus Nealsonbacteria bacterium CG02_land_8_20_14_3_00_37_10]